MTKCLSNQKRKVLLLLKNDIGIFRSIKINLLGDLFFFIYLESRHPDLNVINLAQNEVDVETTFAVEDQDKPHLNKARMEVFEELE